MKAFTWFLIMLITITMIALASIGIAKLLVR